MSLFKFLLASFDNSYVQDFQYYVSQANNVYDLEDRLTVFPQNNL